jgi:hypothetical protein
MQYLFYFITACTLMVLTGCGHTNDELAPWARCQGLNFNFGTHEYEKCVDEEEIHMTPSWQTKEFEPVEKYLQDPDKS